MRASPCETPAKWTNNQHISERKTLLEGKTFCIRLYGFGASLTHEYKIGRINEMADFLL